MSRAVTALRSAIRNATSDSWRISLTVSCDTAMRAYRARAVNCLRREARPAPVLRRARESRRDGVVGDVCQRRGELVVTVDERRGIAAAEEMVGSAVAGVEALRVPAVQVAHAVREIRLGRLDD